MPVSYILQVVGAKTGLNPNVASSRSTLLRWLNEAAEEIYYESDPPNSLQEQAFKVNGDQTISLPWYVGPIRGIREVDSQIVWSMNRMRPRYAQFNWPDSWRNIRLIGEQALQATITNQSNVIVTTPFVENPPVIVTSTGQTEFGSSVSENITLSSTSVQSVNAYINITAIKKNVVNAYDITINDIDGKLLSTIPNCQLTAKYQIYDVSVCPWLAVSTSTLEHYIEILYKKAFYTLYNNEDEFVFGNKYDYVLINKMIQLWNEEQGKPDLATAFDSKATRSVARIQQDQHRATEDKVNFVANEHDTILPRVRPGRRKYYRGYGSRGYGY
jgi:hypothetical protein